MQGIRTRLGWKCCGIYLRSGFGNGQIPLIQRHANFQNYNRARSEGECQSCSDMAKAVTELNPLSFQCPPRFTLSRSGTPIPDMFRD